MSKITIITDIPGEDRVFDIAFALRGLDDARLSTEELNTLARLRAQIKQVINAGAYRMSPKEQSVFKDFQDEIVRDALMYKGKKAFLATYHGAKSAASSADSSKDTVVKDCQPKLAEFDRSQALGYPCSGGKYTGLFTGEGVPEGSDMAALCNYVRTNIDTVSLESLEKMSLSLVKRGVDKGHLIKGPDGYTQLVPFGYSPDDPLSHEVLLCMIMKELSRRPGYNNEQQARHESLANALQEYTYLRPPNFRRVVEIYTAHARAIEIESAEAYAREGLSMERLIQDKLLDKHESRAQNPRVGIFEIKCDVSREEWPALTLPALASQPGPMFSRNLSDFDGDLGYPPYPLQGKKINTCDLSDVVKRLGDIVRSYDGDVTGFAKIEEQVRCEAGMFYQRVVKHRGPKSHENDAPSYAGLAAGTQIWDEAEYLGDTATGVKETPDLKEFESHLKSAILANIISETGKEEAPLLATGWFFQGASSGMVDLLVDSAKKLTSDVRASYILAMDKQRKNK